VLRERLTPGPTTDQTNDEITGADAAFDRQLATLCRLGYPALAGVPEAGFLGLLEPLRRVLPGAGRDVPAGSLVPFVVVVTGGLVPLHELPSRLELTGKQGFTTMEADDVARFRPTADVELPQGVAYLATGLSTGPEHLGAPPEAALPRLLADGHSPLTLEEGLALATHHPELLRDANCFSLLASRCGDRRVTAVWLSKGRPRLGWCYAGAPHTWLGSAWLTARTAAG
jgi:hypothetical protein